MAAGAQQILDIPSEPIDLGKLKKEYTNFASVKNAEIEERKESLKFRHGVQWTAEELAILKKRRQPPVTNNYVARKIDGVVGTLLRLRQDAKAFPRTPSQDEGAEIATECIRYALDRARWPDVEYAALEDAAVSGIGVAAFTIEQGDADDSEVGLERIASDQFFYDPRSFLADFSDCMYMGVAKWLDLDVAQELFPTYREDLEGLVNNGSLESWQQSEREKNWVDPTRKRLFVVEHWYKRSSVWSVCFYASGLLLYEGESPFVDEKGKSTSRFRAFSGYVDHDGDRYGFVRNLKSPQMEVNMRRSKALHILNTRRFMYRKDSVTNVEKFRQEAARPDGMMEYDGEMPQADDGSRTTDMQGHFELLQEAKGAIEGFGPSAALLGDVGKQQSGRAIALLQQTGLAELGPFIKNYRAWKLDIYRVMFTNIQRYWTGERYIRVTDNEEMAKFIELNRLEFDEQGKPTIVNALGSMDVDIIMDESGDTVNTMADTFELLGVLASAGNPIPPQIVIELSPLPGSVKKKVIWMLEQQGQQDPMLEQAKTLELEKAEADVGATRAKGLKDFAQAAQTLVAPIPQELVDVPMPQQPMPMMPQEAGFAPLPF